MKNEINIEKIADLSMLIISKKEKELYQKDLEEIISFCEAVSEINTGDNSVEKAKTELKNIFRNDTVTNNPNREALLKNAETNNGEYISVPKILGGTDE